MVYEIGKKGQKVKVDTKRQKYDGVIVGIKPISMQYTVKIEAVKKGDKEVGQEVDFKFEHCTILEDNRPLAKTRVDNKMVGEWVGRRIGEYKVIEYLGFWKKDNWKQSKHWFKVVHDTKGEFEKTLGTLRKLVKAEEERQVKKEARRVAKEEEKKAKALAKLEGEVVDKKGKGKAKEQKEEGNTLGANQEQQTMNLGAESGK